MSLKFEVIDSILDEIILEIIGKKAAFLTETPKEVVAETPKEVVEENTEEVVSTNDGTEAEKVEAKNGEAEAEKEVAETKEVVEKETEEVVSTNGTEAKEDVVEAKNGEAEATKDEDRNGHESDKEETHKDADMPMPSENGDAKTDVISERSDSMFSYPEFNDKDDQVIPGFFKHQSNIDDQAEHVDELSNQEVPKFGFEDCADVGNVSDEIDFYGDDSKTKVRRTSGLCLILWIGLTYVLGFDDFFNFFLLLHQNVRFRFKNALQRM